MRKDLENKSMERAVDNKTVEEPEPEPEPEVPHMPKRFGDEGNLSFGHHTFGHDVPRSEWDSEQK